jgi:hypothetical protein
MSSRPAWATQQVPGQLGLYSETLSQKRKEGRKEGKKGGREGGRARVCTSNSVILLNKCGISLKKKNRGQFSCRL